MLAYPLPMRSAIIPLAVWNCTPIAAVLAACFLAAASTGHCEPPAGKLQSAWEEKVVDGAPGQNAASIIVDVSDAADPHRPLPLRVIVTASDGSHPDGS